MSSQQTLRSGLSWTCRENHWQMMCSSSNRHQRHVRGILVRCPTPRVVLLNWEMTPWWSETELDIVSNQDEEAMKMQEVPVEASTHNLLEPRGTTWAPSTTTPHRKHILHRHGIHKLWSNQRSTNKGREQGPNMSQPLFRLHKSLLCLNWAVILAEGSTPISLIRCRRGPFRTPLCFIRTRGTQTTTALARRRLSTTQTLNRDHRRKFLYNPAPNFAPPCEISHRPCYLLTKKEMPPQITHLLPPQATAIHEVPPRPTTA